MRNQPSSPLLPVRRIVITGILAAIIPEFGIRQDSQEQINFWCNPEKSCSKESNHEFTRTVL